MTAHPLIPLVLAMLLAATMLVPARPAQAAPAPADGNGFVYFPETGHNVGMKIKRFYDAHGGLEIFGLPLTEVISEDGMQVQYFERARFELHPELPPEFRVSLTRLGARLTEGRNEPAFAWLSASPGGDVTFFPESGHTLRGMFREYWRQHGGVTVFGYPISEELHETNAFNGRTLLVQYFERARFELHAAPSGSYTVQLGHLGRELLSRRPDAAALMAPAPQLQLLGASTTAYHTSAYERRENITRATEMFDGVVVMPGQEYSFLNSGDFSVDAGFVEGYAIVGGRLERVIGGGLCQVSTTMFRAAANAGLEITHRQGHTYVVYFYENILGFDATVFSPSVDFRWRNDTPHPVYIVATTQPAASTVTFEIWGIGDGRVTRFDGPHVRNVVQPGRATWQYDRTLARGQTIQLVHGRPGMDVSYLRTVTLPDGTVVHNDNFYTHYRPWNDFYTYGPGVTPPAGVEVIGPRTVYEQPEQPAQVRRPQGGLQ